jgi:hypothetical protein
MHVQGVVACVHGPNPSAAEAATTPVLTLIYDTRPPVLVTSAEALASITFFTGSRLTVTFSEDLICTRPYVFDVQLVQYSTVGNVSTTSMLYKAGAGSPENELPLLCEGPRLTMLLPKDLGERITLPATIGVLLAGVADLYLNSIPTPVTMPIQVRASLAPPHAAG